MEKKALIDYTDEELREGLRSSAKEVLYSYKNYREELLERSQNKNTKALNTWTFVITIATLLNTVAVICQLAKALNLF